MDYQGFRIEVLIDKRRYPTGTEVSKVDMKRWALRCDRCFNQSHPVIVDRAIQYCLIVAGLEKNWCCRVQPEASSMGNKTALTTAPYQEWTPSLG